MTTLNPRTEHVEFSGAPGAAVITFGLIFVIQFFFFACNSEGCPAGWSLAAFWDQATHTTWISWAAAKAYFAWMATLVVFDFILPGKHVQGTILRTGERLPYKFNGKAVMAVLFSALAYRSYSTRGALPELVFLYDHLHEIANVTILLALAISTGLYLWSFAPNKLLALGGNTGNPIYDWFIGRELNPRFGNFDIKLFLEMRPGLLLWVFINLAMAHHQWLKFGRISDSMLLVCVFQGYYVIEGIFYEEGLVSMMDTTIDGLGFMLVFGDISLVPFTYTLQTRFLADHPVDLGVWRSLAIVGVYVTGILIFRFSNNEKNRFKAGDPSTAHLKYITAESGSKLLVSGWWGVARHINYTGDWIASWAYCLPCGATIIPYYFIVYFAALLVHREMRDEAKCAAKYKKTWIEYKQKVPYRMIPGLY